MIAALPMYERAETAAVHDRYWSLIRGALQARGIAAPARLTRGVDPWQVWRARDLVLAQTCGLPYRARLHGAVALVGTPDYGLPDMPPGYYQSVFCARAGDPRDGLGAFAGARLAYNDPLSQSGWAAALAAGVAFGAAIRTGAHRDSARAVAGGRADLAAIDAVTWRNLERFEPGLTDGLRVVARSAPVPGLPYITAKGRDAAAHAAAVADAIAALAPGDRGLLGITALVPIPAEAYLSLPVPPPPEAARPG